MVGEGFCGGPCLRQDHSHSYDHWQDSVCACLCVCTSANLSEFEKDRFYQMLQCTVAKIPASEQLFVCGD